MEFWGVEVKSGQSLTVKPEFGKLIHISQAALGEVKDVKGAKYVPLRLKINGQKFVRGSLAAEDRPQVMFDMVFEKEFELSHDWKNGSVYFIGYIADDPVSEGEEFSDGDFSDESEDEMVAAPENGLVKPEAIAAKSAAVPAINAAKKEEEAGSDEDGSSDSDSDGDDSLEEDSDDDDMDGSSSEEEEELPKVQQQQKQSKKRPAESPKPTPVSAKKAKSDKPGSAPAPPSKAAAGKTPESNKSKHQSPKSAGQFHQKSGNKSFNSKGKRGGK